MKTKISHLGRSTVSVILAVMMLLSTMLIGTVSTVNAVTKKFNSVNLVGNINGNTKWDSTEYPFTFDETTGNWYLDITITQSSEFKARVDGKWDTSFGASGGNYTISEIGDYRISVKDGAENGTDLKVEKTVKKVADSVTLTANPTSVKVGKPVTLTPTVSSAKSDNLTYAYKKTSDGTATEEKNADNSLTVTPTVAGTYKYTVTVSAEGFSPVTSTEVSFTVTVTDSVKYYLGGRVKQAQKNSEWIAPDSTDTSYQFVETEIDGLYKYESNQTPDAWSEKRNDLLQYFYVRTSLGGALYYGNDESSDDALALTAQGQKANLAEIKNTDVKNLIYIKSNDTSTKATFWLDTRNNEYKLWYTTALSHKVNVEEGVSASVDRKTATAGETVTVTATPTSGEVLDKVTVEGADNKSIATTVSGNIATFIMPDQDVTVTNVTFRKAKECKVTIANNITNGSVKANDNSSEITVTEGTPVTLVATPNDSYSFISWSITPEDCYTVADGSMTSATATIYPTDNITVSASFAQSTVSTDHFLAWGEGEKIEDWTDGAKTYSSTDGNGKKIYTADLNPSLFKENTWYRFAVTKKIPSSNDRLNSGDLHYNYNGFTVNGYSNGHEEDNVKTEPREYGGNYYGMFRYSGELVSLSISYNEGTKNYQVTPVVKVHNGAKLYAKNGSCRTDKQYANNMHTKGTTTISYDTTKYDVDVDTKSSSSWQIAYLSEDNIKDEVKLTITTTVTDQEYYLAGWCVDGETYLPKTTNTESNEYSFDYYVKSTTKLTDTIEVTPVYFYKTSADTETVRFYVTGFDDTVKKDWGNTIAVYPY